MPDGDWEAILRRQHGVFTRRQALRYMSAKVLERRTATGRWQAIHRGVFASHNGPVSATQLLWAASLAVSAGGPALLAGPTALVLHGLRRFESPLIHVLVPPGRRSRRPPSDVRIHRTTTVAPADVAHTSPPSTTPARAVVDAAAWARSDREARTVIAMSVQQRLVVAADVEIVLRRMPSSIARRQLIVRTVADVSGGAHSLGELDLIALCRSEGLPSPTRQHRRDGRYLDAVWSEWGVWVEVDGAHHMSADQWWDDMARHNELVRRNEVLLRFPAWMVRDRPTEVADRIRRALREAGWN